MKFDGIAEGKWAGQTTNQSIINKKQMSLLCCVDWWLCCFGGRPSKRLKIFLLCCCANSLHSLNEFNELPLKLAPPGFHSLHFLFSSRKAWAPFNLYIPLLALHVINFMYLFILHKNIQLWLLDSYPLHINYCYNTFWFLPFHSRERNESQQNERNLFLLLVEWNGVWLNGCPPLQASLRSALRGCGLWVFSSRNSIQTPLPLTLYSLFNKSISKRLLVFFLNEIMNGQAGRNVNWWNQLKWSECAAEEPPAHNPPALFLHQTPAELHSIK